MCGRQELHVTGFKDNDSLNLNVKRQMSAAKTAVSFSLLGLSLATLRHAQVFAALSVSAQIRRRNRVNTSELLRSELVAVAGVVATNNGQPLDPTTKCLGIMVP